MLCGGAEHADVDDKVKEVVSQVRGEVEQRADESFPYFEPVEVMKQVVGYTSSTVTLRSLAWITSLRWMLVMEELFLLECKWIVRFIM